MTFGEHLEELRWRLIRAILAVLAGMLIAFAFSDRLMAVIVQPYLVAARWQGAPELLQALEPTEVFMVVLKMSFLVGVLISSPYVFYQIWAFVAAGLYPHERRVVTRMVPYSVCLFALGVAFLFAIVLPLALRFLLAMNSWVPMPSGEPNPVLGLLLGRREGVAALDTQPTAPLPQVPVLDADPPDPPPYTMWVNQREAKLKISYGQGQILTADLRVARRAMVESRFDLGRYVSFVTGLAFGFGLGFQVPLVVVLLARIGVASVAQMRKARRFVILGAFVAGAVLTPTPDAYNMLLLTVPMIALFEIGLLVAQFMERRHAVQRA